MGWSDAELDSAFNAAQGGGWSDADLDAAFDSAQPQQPEGVNKWQVDPLGSIWQGVKNIPGAVKGAVTAPFGIVSDMGQGLGDNLNYLVTGDENRRQSAIQHLSAAADPMLRLGLGTAGFLVGGPVGGAAGNQLASKFEQGVNFAPMTSAAEDVNQMIADTTTGGVMVVGAKAAPYAGRAAGRLLPESAKTQAVNAYNGLDSRANAIEVTPTVMNEAAMQVLAKDNVPRAVASKIANEQALVDALAADQTTAMSLTEALNKNKQQLASAVEKSGIERLNTNDSILANRDRLTQMLAATENERGSAIAKLGPYGLDKVSVGSKLTNALAKEKAAVVKSMEGDGSPFKGLNNQAEFPIKNAKTSVADIIDQEFPRITNGKSTQVETLNTFRDTADPKVVRLWDRFTKQEAGAKMTIVEAQALRHEVSSMARDYGRNLSMARNRGGDTAPLQANYRVLKAMEKGLVTSAEEGAKAGVVPKADVGHWKQALSEYSDYVQTYKVGAVEKVTSPFAKESQSYQRITRSPEDFSQALKAAGPKADALKAMVRNVELTKLAASDFTGVKKWSIGRGAIVKDAFSKEHLADLQKIGDSFDKVDSLKTAAKMNRQRLMDRKEQIGADLVKTRGVLGSEKAKLTAQKSNLAEGQKVAQQAGESFDVAVQGAKGSAADVIAESISANKLSPVVHRLIQHAIGTAGLYAGGPLGAIAADVTAGKVVSWFEKRPDAAKALLADMLEDPAMARQLTQPANSQSLAPYAKAVIAAAMSQSDQREPDRLSSVQATQSTKIKSPVPVIPNISKPSSSNPTPEPLNKLVQAIIQTESAGNPKAVSSKGAAGLMQLMPQNQKAFGVTDPFDPAQNIAGGTALLKEELTRYGDLALALAAYNAGSPAVNKAIKRAGSNDFDKVAEFLPAETRAYVPKVLAKLS